MYVLWISPVRSPLVGAQKKADQRVIGFVESVAAIEFNRHEIIAKAVGVYGQPKRSLTAKSVTFSISVT